MDISPGILFGLISMVGFGLSNAISKAPVQAIGPIKTIYIRNMMIGILMLIVLVFWLPQVDFSLAYILISFGIAVFGYFPLVTFYKAIKVGKVGIVSPIAGSSIIFTVLLSLIFFGESMTLTKTLSLTLITAGIILISINLKNVKTSDFLKFSSGIPYALITCIGWGIVFFLLKIPVDILGPILTSFVLELGTLIMSVLHLRKQRESFHLPKGKILRLILYVAVFGAAGTLFLNLGISRAEVSIVAPLAAASPLIATIYGIWVYKERLRIHQYAAIVLMIVGIVFLSCV